MMMNPLSWCLFMVAMSGCTTAQGIFYPFGSAAGDTFSNRADDGSSPIIPLLRPLPFFGRTYQQIFVNHNGHITFNQSLSRYVPDEFPANSTMDIIAPFWTDLNNRESGNITYQQYTSGDVLQTATKDIRSYFPSMTFTASWVFVATWDRVAYYSNRGTENTFQVVLISDSKLAFIFMNYGDIAPSSSPILSQPSSQVQIGYDTISSTHYGSLRTCYPNNIIDIVNLKTSSNVNIQGRWAFLTTLQSTSFSCTNTPRLPEPQPDHVLGVRLKVSSFEDLNEEQIEEQILKPFGDLLSQHGIDVSGLRLRRIYKTEP